MCNFVKPCFPTFPKHGLVYLSVSQVILVNSAFVVTMTGRAGSTDCRIYVGNLPPNIREQELDDLFYKYGTIRHIDLKNKRGTPYAFIDYEDYR